MIGTYPPPVLFAIVRHGCRIQPGLPGVGARPGHGQPLVDWRLRLCGFAAPGRRPGWRSFQADNDSEDFGFVGTPQQIVEQMRSFIDLGVNRFILDCQDFPRTGTLERLLAQVLPGVVGE
jgi:alkanesulfonate monooxygenase SsuD/methylene tetrahydromethanopterin reductase-like flavin-dependent oxidoreductase (luciferase family)